MAVVSPTTPVVVFGDDWRRHVSTLQHLFAHMIAGQPVVWVNSFGHRAPQLTLYDVKRAFAKLRAMATASQPDRASGPSPARIIEPRALPWHNLKIVRVFNRRSLLYDIRRALGKVARGQRPVLVTGTPVAADIVGELNEVVSIYFCMDDYGELPGVDKRIIGPLERLMLDRVDAVVATAAALARKKTPRSGLSFQLPQGVNFERFATPRPVPADILTLPRPIVGFAGGVSAACDFQLIDKLATAFPGGSMVLVGPLHPGVVVPQRSNIHVLGNRSYEDLPGYVQAFDVGIIPYMLSDWIRSVDPLKLLEYLAAGIPVVSTDIPEAHKYAHAVRITDSHADFIAAVRAASDESTETHRAERRAVARQHTWESRAQRFAEIVDDVMARRTVRP